MFNINELADRALEIAAEAIYDASHASVGREHRYRLSDETEAAEMVRKDRDALDDVYAFLVVTLRDRRVDRRQALTESQNDIKL